MKKLIYLKSIIFVATFLGMFALSFTLERDNAETQEEFTAWYSVTQVGPNPSSNDLIGGLTDAPEPQDDCNIEIDGVRCKVELTMPSASHPKPSTVQEALDDEDVEIGDYAEVDD